HVDEIPGAIPSGRVLVAHFPEEKVLHGSGYRIARVVVLIRIHELLELEIGVRVADDRPQPVGGLRCEGELEPVALRLSSVDEVVSSGAAWNLERYELVVDVDAKQGELVAMASGDRAPHTHLDIACRLRTEA